MIRLGFGTIIEEVVKTLCELTIRIQYDSRAFVGSVRHCTTGISLVRSGMFIVGIGVGGGFNLAIVLWVVCFTVWAVI